MAIKDLSESETDNLRLLVSIFAWLSLSTSLFLLFVLQFNERKKAFPSNLTMYFGLSGCLMSASMTFGSIVGYDKMRAESDLDDNESTEDILEGLCTFQGILAQFFSVAIVLWWCTISVNLFLVIVKEKRIESPKSYHIIVWTIAGIATLIPAIFDSFSDSGFWCWVKSYGYQFGTLYVIWGFSTVICIYCWSGVLIKIHRISKEKEAHARSSVISTTNATANQKSLLNTTNNSNNYGTSSSPSATSTTAFVTAVKNSTNDNILNNSNNNINVNAPAGINDEVNTVYSPLISTSTSMYQQWLSFKRYIRHLLFIGIFIIIFAVAMTNRVFISNHETDLYELWVIHVACIGGIGFAYFLIFGVPISFDVNNEIYGPFVLQVNRCFKNGSDRDALGNPSGTVESTLVDWSKQDGESSMTGATGASRYD